MPVEGFRIKVSDRSWADTTGSLRIGVRQGDMRCGSVTDTFYTPRRNTEYTQENEQRFGTCTKDKLFQPMFNNNPLQIRILSNSGNDAFIDKMAVKIAGQWREWIGHHFKINKHFEGPWQTVVEAGLCLLKYCVQEYSVSENRYC